MKKIVLGPDARVLDLDAIMQWGDIIEWNEDAHVGEDPWIVMGLAGKTPRSLGKHRVKAVFRGAMLIDALSDPGFPLCENCFTRHAPGENDLCEL